MTVFEAAQKGDCETVKKFLQYGGDVNSKIITGSTLLMIAASYGREEVVKLLIDNGADINAVNYDGLTALMWGMTTMGSTGVVRLIIEAKADVNASFRRSNTAGANALIFASALGRTDAVKLLIENGADLDSRDNEGKSAMDRAAV